MVSLFFCQSNQRVESLMGEPRTKPCSKCKEVLPYTAQYFYRCASKTSGLHASCKKCTDWARNNRAKSNGYQRTYLKEVARPRLKALKNSLKRKCEMCGYDRCKQALHFHHVGEKAKDVSRMMTITSIKSDVCRCMVLCANCHAEVHVGAVSI